MLSRVVNAMNIKTVCETARILEVQESLLRRLIRSGKLKTLRMGNRQMLDVDDARKVLAAHAGVGIREIMAETGLTENAIRCGCREGWIPYRMDGNAYSFDIEKVKRAIQERMK